MLYIIATPIGNLKDITLRALEVFKEVDYILCEDTRVTQKLLAHYQISKPLISYHQHSRLAKIDYIVKLLKEGKNLALVSDAGTPGISDPGNQLIQLLITNYKLPITVIPIPGPSAAIAALSISGFSTDRFMFLGFPPHKKGRQKFLKEVGVAKETVVFYESTHRIEKLLNELMTMDDKLNMVVARELTKKFETIYRGTPSEILEQIKNDDKRGEFVVVIGK
ncbi:MAG: 16S rRNA (cytidine(1402)-2'-O)-methyltransferase [Patescibacteria group bacterium]|nr:16S rRNA (cytidine(1402)-2'-O)-methyltransferase [Patescibacteria group bacterium]MDD5121644.1 16S rRNA (cytidine(1402)-2'-O)-methyltransferase [Patescibacteria group bacterium]MDD5221902.1 16S rRNA (cytidine(1402)-2'-O)-methyltransferase [Patescibacteria group bacterium]MDD5396192.1 16S rRNA (cytidine(1402)-2'-O)-methyltransferase [Patescibacteria group bacterium]